MRLFTATVATLAAATSAYADPQKELPRVAPPEVRAVAPALADYTDGVLFGDLWKRPELTPRDRSIVTLSALIAGGHTRQMPGHLNRALDNGVTPAEITGLITHLAFYAGWPNAISAVGVTKDLFAKRGIAPDQPASLTSGAPPGEQSAPSASTNQRTTPLEIVRSQAQQPSNGPAEYFTGSVQIASRFQREAPARIGGAVVAFEPGARTAWHTHPLGQTLIVTAGTGWVQKEGGPVEEIRPGDIVWIPPGEKHWHGATAASALTHVAIAEALDGKSVEWMEQVTEDQYAAGTRSSAVD